MRIDSSGRLGINTSSPSARLQVNQTTSAGAGITMVGASASTDLTSDFGSLSLQNTNTTNGNYNILGFVNDQGGFSSAIYGIYTSHTSGSQSGAMAFSTRNAGSFAERMRIDSSGMLGLGITPNQTSGIAMEFGGSANNNAINFLNSSNLQGWITSNAYYNGTNWLRKFAGGGTCTAYTANDQGCHVWRYAAASTVGSTISWSEAMRIDASGNLVVGATSALYGGRVEITKNGERCLVLHNTATGAGANSIQDFYRNTTLVGTISTTNTNTVYGTGSDYRLKENIAPMTGALETVAKLKPVTYRWKLDGSDGQGFIAHELQEIAPYAVTGEKDGEQMQGVDYGKITPLLTAALQEALAKIESLEVRLAVLESK
jgi:hypothetical protein